MVEKPQSVYHGVVETLGKSVVEGTRTPGDILTVEQIEAMTGASRSVVREAVRVLAALGLVTSRKRVGVVVLPQSEWNDLDPRVIRWRLESPHRAGQLRALQEIRAAIEPDAARLAALRATQAEAGRIMSVAGELLSTGIEGDHEAFLAADALFHRLILSASGNAMFARLSGVVREALRERNLVELENEPIDRAEIQVHIDLAAHIQRGDAEAARNCALQIITRA